MKSIILYIILFSSQAFAQSFNPKFSPKGRSFNPNLGGNILFLNRSSSRDTDNDGLDLQEVELQFQADIDTNFTGWLFLGIEKDETTGEWGIEPEEAYVETTSVPHAIIRVGKSYMPFGKQNQLHSHALTFIDQPLINETVFGDERLNESGLGAMVLLPLPWFSELSLYYTQGENELLFNSPENDNKAYLTRLANLFDLTDNLTLEGSLSGATGQHVDNQATTLLGADLTLKWIPASTSTNKSFEWSSEFLQKDKKGVNDGKLSGLTSYLKYQFARQWYGQYRYDHQGLTRTSSQNIARRHAALLAYAPSEFSAIRMQVDTLSDGQVKSNNRVLLQFNMSIGAHPAHGY